MKKAFVLGAGLGTRLKSLTEQLPKPLVPVGQKPLITYAFDHLKSEGIEEFVVNTHHRAEQYETAFPDATYQGSPITFRNESVLLETAGGIANVKDLFAGEESFVVYNGDILTDFPLKALIDAHEASDHLVTLALRSEGPALHIAWNAATGKVTDIRNMLETGDSGAYLFTGVYIVRKAFLDLLTPGKKESVIPIFLNAIKNENAIGGMVVDEGNWWDLGNRDTYLSAHQELIGGRNPEFPRYGAGDSQWKSSVHQTAVVAETATVDGESCVGNFGEVGTGARLENTVVWPGGKVASEAHLKRCIVRSGETATGTLEDADV